MKVKIRLSRDHKATIREVVERHRGEYGLSLPMRLIADATAREELSEEHGIVIGPRLLEKIA